MFISSRITTMQWSPSSTDLRLIHTFNMHVTLTNQSSTQVTLCSVPSGSCTSRNLRFWLGWRGRVLYSLVSALSTMSASSSTFCTAAELHHLTSSAAWHSYFIMNGIISTVHEHVTWAHQSTCLRETVSVSLDDGTDVVELAKSNDSSLRIPVMNEERMRRVGNLARLGGVSPLCFVQCNWQQRHSTYHIPKRFSSTPGGRRRAIKQKW